MSSANVDLAIMRGLGAYQDAQSIVRRALERLATGKRINRASDDPSGLAAVDEFKARSTQIERKLKALEFENYRLAAQDGSMSVLSDMLVEMNGLVTRAANRGAMSDQEREALQVEADSIVQGISFIANSTIFNGEQIMSGYSAGALGTITETIDNGDGTTRTVTYSLADLATGGSLNLLTGDLEKAKQVAERAVSGLSTRRAAIGARMNENDSQTRVLLSEFEAVESSRSILEDADYAREVAELIRGRILEQAAARTIQVSQLQARSALKLLDAAVGG